MISLPTIGIFTTTGPKDLADVLPRGVGIDAVDCRSLGRFQGFRKLCVGDVDMRLQTSLSRRRSSITVHPQSAVASARSGYERHSIHAPREMTNVKELILRVLRSGGTVWD